MSHEDYLRQSEEELNAADLLFNNGFYKEAVSRAYYSMFHAAQALLFIRDVYPKSHKGVIHKFGEEFVKTGLLERKMGQMLSQAESMRMKADYDVVIVIKKEECEDTIKKGKLFLSKVKEVISELNLQRPKNKG